MTFKTMRMTPLSANNGPLYEIADISVYLENMKFETISLCNRSESIIHYGLISEETSFSYSQSTVCAKNLEITASPEKNNVQLIKDYENGYEDQFKFSKLIARFMRPWLSSQSSLLEEAAFVEIVKKEHWRKSNVVLSLVELFDYEVVISGEKGKITDFNIDLFGQSVNEVLVDLDGKEERLKICNLSLSNFNLATKQINFDRRRKLLIKAQIEKSHAVYS